MNPGDPKIAKSWEKHAINASDVMFRKGNANGKRLYSSTTVRTNRLCDFADGTFGPNISTPRRSNSFDAFTMWPAWEGLKNLGLHSKQVLQVATTSRTSASEKGRLCRWMYSPRRVTPGWARLLCTSTWSSSRQDVVAATWIRERASAELLSLPQRYWISYLNSDNSNLHRTSFLLLFRLLIRK